MAHTGRRRHGSLGAESRGSRECVLCGKKEGRVVLEEDVCGECREYLERFGLLECVERGERSVFAAFDEAVCLERAEERLKERPDPRVEQGNDCFERLREQGVEESRRRVERRRSVQNGDGMGVF